MSRDRKYKSHFKSNNKEEGKIMNMNKKQIMTEMNVNNKFKTEKWVKMKKLAKYGIYTAGVIAAGLICTEVALAGAKFDVNAGVTAATKPLIDGVKAHWGKGVLLTGSVSALVGEGDGRQRAIRAIVASGAAGGAVLGLIALLT